MTKEFEAARDTFGLTLDDFEIITVNAMKSAFLPYHSAAISSTTVHQTRLRQSAASSLSDRHVHVRARRECDVPCCPPVESARERRKSFRKHKHPARNVLRRRIFIRPMAVPIAARNKQHRDRSDARHKKRIMISPANHLHRSESMFRHDCESASTIAGAHCAGASALTSLRESKLAASPQSFCAPFDDASQHRAAQDLYHEYRAVN